MTAAGFDLERFLDAQAPVIAQVQNELRAGAKRTHWMWFVFPQIAGLGRSAMAQRYAIASLDEAKAYADHPVLGARLRDCTALVLAVEGKSVHAIFDSPDDLKFYSCMTGRLFLLKGRVDASQISPPQRASTGRSRCEAFVPPK